jgi:hypothetical protein
MLFNEFKNGTILNAFHSQVKAALHRALSMPESNSKHTEVQEICNLISVMIDSCPSPVPPCPYAILGSIDKPPCT